MQLASVVFCFIFRSFFLVRFAVHMNERHRRSAMLGGDVSSAGMESNISINGWETMHTEQEHKNRKNTKSSVGKIGGSAQAQ